jgi:RimJ/RimL family protein N-acetyltransferase
VEQEPKGLPITTERLILRRYTHDDIPDLLRVVSHSSVARVTTEITATEPGVRAYIDLQNSYQPFEQDKCFDLAIERKKDGRVMGLLSLVHKQDQQAEIGWALGTEFRGQGYVTEAASALVTYGFASLGLHRIQAVTSSTNTGSRGVMERLGMRQEARLRETTFTDGEWLDSLIYGLLVSEWQGRNPDHPPFSRGTVAA